MKKLMMFIVTLAMSSLALAGDIQFDRQLKNGHVINFVESCEFASREVVAIIVTSRVDQMPVESVAKSNEKGCVELSLIGDIGEQQRIELTSESHPAVLSQELVLIGN
jgi:uncharacterized phosphosugar-binding protein